MPVLFGYKCTIVRCVQANISTSMKNIIIFISLFLSCSALSASLKLRITDSSGEAIPFAVAELYHADYPAEVATDGAKVLQKGLNFQPFVSVVPQGTLVEFPNLDKTRHHVYSFSKAKTFELKLYAGKPEAPVLFDLAGVVTLGCNIHDHMLAYLYVSESKYAAVTADNGEVQFDNLPQKTFTLRLWHPWQTEVLPEQSISIAEGNQTKTIKLNISAQELPKAPKTGFGDY